MVKCKICKINKATTWYKKEQLCESCFNKKKYKRQGNPSWLDKLVTKKR